MAKVIWRDILKETRNGLAVDWIVLTACAISLSTVAVATLHARADNLAGSAGSGFSVEEQF